MNVGGEADHALHVVAVYFSWRGAVFHFGDIAQHGAGDIGACSVVIHDGQILNVFGRSHFVLRDFDLNLEGIAASGVSPEVGVRETARRGAGHQRLGHIGHRQSKLSGPIAIDGDPHRWVIQRLGILEIAQGRNLLQLATQFFGKAAIVWQAGTLHRDFNRRG